MEQAGNGRIIRLLGQPELVAADVIVPGDPSSAAFPIVAALLVPGSRITIQGVGLNPARIGLFTTLVEMGADLVIANERTAGGEPVGDVTVTHTALRGIEVPPERAPSMIDEYPILAAAAATAQGRTTMRGLKELRVKESDRLAATASLLQVSGVQVTVEGDDLTVEGGRVPGGATVETHMDHRLAMTALVLGQAADAPIAVDDAAFIDTSFPGFAALMRGLGVEIDG
jgi:3-phosphoshikimate 1-carboxyvinyltransferase